MGNKKGFKRVILDKFRSIFRVTFLERWLVTLTRHKLYGTTVTKFAPNHYSYSNPSWRNVVRYGLTLNLDISKLVDWFTYFYFNDKEHEWLIDSVKPGFVMVDVGANIGILSMRMANRVKPSGRVLSYEPYLPTFERLSSHISLNNLTPWVAASAVALGSKPGQD
jgi:Met-10+ like-protein